MKPLYLVGTQRNVGKTTLSIGLVDAFRQRGLSVGYTKPLGQRVKSVQGEYLHDDALVVSRAMGLTEAESARMTVPLVRGRVEQEIHDPHPEELAEKVAQACEQLQRDHDVVVVEGMGHVAMGACLGMSAAEVAKVLGAMTVIISGGGIGRTIDEIALCATYMTARGAEVAGAVVNKVWPEKYDRVKKATAKGLESLGIRPLGVVPYEQMLASPTIGQVADQLGGEVLCGHDALDNRVLKTIVAAMEAHNMVAYVNGQVMVITPGDRSDNIMAVVSAHMLSSAESPAVAGMLLTGGLRPGGRVMEMLSESGLPAMLCEEDTYTLASRLRDMLFKIAPDDRDRIEGAMRVVNEFVNVEAILESLKQ